MGCGVPRDKLALWKAKCGGTNPTPGRVPAQPGHGVTGTKNPTKMPITNGMTRIASKARYVRLYDAQPWDTKGVKGRAAAVIGE